MLTSLFGNTEGQGNRSDRCTFSELTFKHNCEPEGPELDPNSSPPARVFHPKAGIGILEDEKSRPIDGESSFCYNFPDDPNAYVHSQGPCRGKKEPSIYEVFLCN